MQQKITKLDLSLSKAHAAETGKENVSSIGRQFFKVSFITTYLVKLRWLLFWKDVCRANSLKRFRECLLPGLSEELFNEQDNKDDVSL